MAISSLGDLTPSAMLRKMRCLRPVSDHSSGLFRFGFFRVLPTEVSNILVVLENESLDSLAKKADKILEQRADAPGSVAAISPSPSSPLLSIGEVDAVRRFLHSQETRGGAPEARPSRGDSGQSICKNHARWGTKSFSCRPGCLLSYLPLAKRSGNSNTGC